MTDQQKGRVGGVQYQLPTLSTNNKCTNTRYLQQPWTSSSPNRKKQQLQKNRLKQIQLEDKALKSKIQSIRQRRLSEGMNRTFKRSLHQTIRDEERRTVRLENQSLRKRVEQKKATIDSKKLEKEWEDQLMIRKVISKHKRDGERTNRLTSYSSTINAEKCCRYRKFHGFTLKITIEQYIHVLLIWAIVKQTQITMVMVIQLDKIQSIFSDSPSNLLQAIISSLNFDSQLNTLYYLTDDKQLQQHFISDQCSEYDFSTLRKVIRIQHQMIEEKNRNDRKKQEDKAENDTINNNEVKGKDVYKKQ